MVLSEINFSVRQSLGRREDQEDSYALERLDDGGLLLAVADGVGGHAAGQVASNMAVTGFLEGFHCASENRLEMGLSEANRQVGNAIDEDPGTRQGMATTLLALCLRGTTLQWVSVGDSPLLLLRYGLLGQLNDDHSGNSLPGLGISRNLLLSALTGRPIPARDLRSDPFELYRGDTLIAATDGLLSLPLEALSQLVSEMGEAPTREVVNAILNAVAACGNPKQDNTTVGVIRIP